MPIEFRCTKCDRLLRTPDGTSGKEAKCPQCGAMVRIPDVLQPPSPRAPSPAALRETVAYRESPNPYQTPQTAAPTSKEPIPPLQPTRVELGEMISRSWRVYTRNLGPTILAALIIAFFSAAVTGAVFVAFFLVANNLRGVPLGAASVFALLAYLATTTFFVDALKIFMLKIAREDTFDMAALAESGPFVLRGMAINLIVIAATCIGAVFFIVPGIIIFLMFSQAIFVLVDRDTDVVESLRQSAEIMSGNKLTYLLVLLLVSIVGSFVTTLSCGLGAIFVMPFQPLLQAVFYLGVTGQPTVLDEPAPPTAERPFGPAGAQPPEGNL